MGWIGKIYGISENTCRNRASQSPVDWNEGPDALRFILLCMNFWYVLTCQKTWSWKFLEISILLALEAQKRRENYFFLVSLRKISQEDSTCPKLNHVSIFIPTFGQIDTYYGATYIIYPTCKKGEMFGEDENSMYYRGNVNKQNHWKAPFRYPNWKVSEKIGRNSSFLSCFIFTTISPNLPK